MKTSDNLHSMLPRMDGRGYPSYKELRGRYDFGDFTLSIDHVQGDPFAAPSKVSAFMPHRQAGFLGEWIGLDTEDRGGLTQTPATEQRRRALEDFLVRRLSGELAHRSYRVKGSGKSGLLATSRPGPEVLTRTACEVSSDGITVRFEVGLPAHGRRIDGRAAERLLLDLVPAAVRATLVFDAYDERSVWNAHKAIDLADDQLFVRQELERLGLVAFVADGSILPRESGASEKPMRKAKPFSAPESLQVTLDLPHRGPTRGLGIRRGVTLIVGGGYHGKSTLLQALQAGVYDHVAGDGRELVITDDTACKLRAEDGRAVHGVDVSPFIGELPNGIDTRRFSTDDASGSTSQAASLVEDVEAGCRALLIDEDTSATNFMVRDALMEQVVSRAHEPITPFVERVRSLWEQAGVSSVIVAGSSGSFFYAADTVIQMESYEALDITARVREVLERRDAAGVPGLAQVGGFEEPQGERSAALPEGADTPQGGGRHGRGDRRLKVRVQGRESFQVGPVSCDLRLVEQIADAEQTAALAQMVRYCLERGLLQGGTVEQVVDKLRGRLVQGGLAAFGSSSHASCGLAMPREQEIYACLNRLRLQR